MNMETTSIFIGTSFQAFQAFRNRWRSMAQVWSEKNPKKRMEPTSRKRPTVILQPKPTVSV